MATVATAGSYGAATAVPIVTIDAKGRVTTVTTAAPSDTTKVPLAGGTMTGQLVVPDLSVSGLTGATAASRYVGATASGAPSSGTFAVGDFVIDQTAAIWVCTTAGTPGTWTKVGGGSLTNASSFITANVTLTNASTWYQVTSLSLAGGTWLLSAQAAYSIANANATLQLLLGPTSASATSAYSQGYTFGPSTSGEYGISCQAIVTLASTTTVYLNALSSTASATVSGGGSFSGITSGFTAVKIA